jgi:hypothetical protein
MQRNMVMTQEGFDTMYSLFWANPITTRPPLPFITSGKVLFFVETVMNALSLYFEVILKILHLHYHEL